MKRLSNCRPARLALTLGALLAATGAVTDARASHHGEESPWFLNVGYASIRYQSEADIQAGGGPVPGAALHLVNSKTMVADIGYRVTPEFTVRGTVGVPPKTQVEGRGSVAALGRLGEVKYGPAMLTGTWSFDLGPVRPYVGGGFTYIHILETKDGAVTGLTAKSKFDVALQTGVDFRLDKSWGLYLDLRKVHWRTTANGKVPALGGAPVAVTLTPSPLVLIAGITKYF